MELVRVGCLQKVTLESGLDGGKGESILGRQPANVKVPFGKHREARVE